MAKSIKILALLVFSIASISADVPSTRPAAAITTYKDAIAAADSAREKSVERARQVLLKELKAAEKASMQQGDLASANKCEELIKFNASADTLTPPHKELKSEQPPFIGSTIKCASGRTFTLRPDGSMLSSNDGPGSWKLLSDRSVLVTFDNHRDWIRIFNFDDAGKSFKSVSFQQKETDSGVSVREPLDEARGQKR